MKRLICVILTVCLLMAAVVPAASARSHLFFSDADQIRNAKQVELLVNLGILSGYEDGTFRPGVFITREQAAKILAMVCTEDPSQLPEDTTGVTFADTMLSWAKLFIAYCAARQILVGHAGTFRPKDNVSAQEFCKTLLVLLGHEPDRYTGANWSENVYLDAMAEGILHGFEGNYYSALSRDNAALLLYNALLCPAVLGRDDAGEPIYATDELMNPITYLEYRYGIVLYSQVLTANECADLTEKGAALDAGISRLAGHIRPFAVSTDLSLLGKTVNIYVKGDSVIQVCADADETCVDVSCAEFSKLLSGNACSLAEDCAYYRNYAPVDASVLDWASSGDQLIAVDRDGDTVMDAVFVNDVIYGTVVSASPLRVNMADRVLSATAFDSSDTFTKGQTVRCFTVNGTVYVVGNGTSE